MRNDNRVAVFRGVLDEMCSVFERKDSDYGNSFGASIREFGYVVSVARINDKLSRLKKMVKGGDMRIQSETMRDNLLDIANYCVLTVMELDSGTDIE